MIKWLIGWSVKMVINYQLPITSYQLLFLVEPNYVVFYARTKI